MKHILKSSLCLLLALLFSACSFAPEHATPRLPLPEAWEMAKTDTPALNVDWWKRFKDPVLTDFIEEALTNNRQLDIALAQLDQARAAFGLARAEQLPLISGLAQGTQVWSNGNRIPSSDEPWEGRLGASWEIDLWGKYRNASEASRAEMLAMEANQYAVWLSVVGETANGYFLLRSLDSQYATAQSTLKTRTEALTIYKARYDQGLIGELDLVQAQTTVETARTALYQTQLAREQAEAALATLLGRSPRAIMHSAGMKRGTSLEELPTSIVIPAGLPSDLLVRRPDIRMAEEYLRAANANIGVARAAYLPEFSITGFLGIASPELHSLIKNPLDMAGVGGSVTMPLLDFGRVSSNVDAAEAQQREAMATYELTVLQAFRDVHNALAAQSLTADIVDSLQRMVGELMRATDLARTRYDNGYSSYLDVLDAERSLFEAELDLAAAKRERLSSIVSVCLELGGGWIDNEKPLDPQNPRGKHTFTRPNMIQNIKALQGE